MKHCVYTCLVATAAFFHWLRRSVRALKLAYSYVFTGRKFDAPVAWKTI